MTVHIVKPYSLDKNLGKAYNDAMRLIPDGDWACLMDYDTMFLTPDCGKILHDYAERFENVGMLTCWTNRIHPLATDQLYNPKDMEDTNIKHHIRIADILRKDLYKATPIKKAISGFLMMVNRSTWNDIQFSESGKCLGVDNDYCYRLFDNGRSIYRMDGLYVWHSYRLMNGISDKTHLK